MKFRGKMIDNSSIRQFTQLVSLVARLSKICVIRISSSKIYFAISEVGGSSPGLWAEIEQGHYFSEFDLEGVTQEENEIYLELVAEKLAKTLNLLKTSQSTKSLKIKLTKKQSPCLSFLVEVPSLSAKPRLVVHDIPVGLIPRRLWHLYQEPAMPQFQVSVYLPALKQFRHVVDRYKSLCSKATLSANKKGTLIISANTDDADVSTFFKNLPSPVWDKNESGAAQSLEELFSTTIDIKKLSSFLQGEQLHPSKVICNIVDSKMIHLFLLNDDVTLQYFIPGINSG